MARPTDYNQDIANRICELLAEGKSLRAIGRMDNMPSRDSIMRWEKEHEDFATNIARARIVKYEDDIEQLEEINEAVLSGTLDPSAAVAVSNNLKWTASRLLPQFRDRQEIDHKGKAAVIVTASDKELLAEYAKTE